MFMRRLEGIELADTPEQELPMALHFRIDNLDGDGADDVVDRNGDHPRGGEAIGSRQ